MNNYTCGEPMPPPDLGLTGNIPLPPLIVEGVPVSTESTGTIIDTLARMEPRTIINQIALAHALGVSTRTLRRLVARNELPPGVRLGARRVWLAGDVLGHLQHRTEKAAREAERTARRMEAHRQ